MTLTVKNRLMAAAVVMLFAGCAMPVKPETAAKIKGDAAGDPRVEQMLAQASQALAERDLQKELSLHREIVKQFPDDERSVTAYYRLGRHYLNLRYYQPALTSFKTVADRFPGSAYHKDSIIGIGISQVYLKKHKQAEATLKEALVMADSDEQRSAIIYHMGENEYLQDRHNEAVKMFVRCREISGSFQNQAERRVKQIFHKFLSEKELLATAELYGDSFPADLSLLELAEIYRRNGDVPRFTRVKEQIEQLFPGISVPEGSLAAPQIAGPTGILTIGCILPLSGKDAATGKQALQGIQLAFSLQNELVERIGIRLIIKDSASDPSMARAAAAELASDNSVIGIIGPFSNRTTETVIEPLSPYSIPLLTPADSSEIDTARDDGVPIYTIGVTAKTQGRVLAELAVKTLGLYRLAIIYQEDSYGERVTGSFVDAATALSADIIAIESYDPASTDFGEQIRAIGGKRDSEIRDLIYNIILQEPDKLPEELNEILEILYQNNLSVPYIVKYKELPLTHDNFSLGLKMNYDAVLIPANHDRAGLIMPELAFYNITGVQILGSARYASKELLRLGGKYTEGVVFPGEFVPAVGSAEADSFISGFENAFGNQPDISAARAFDAVNLLVSLMESGNNTRFRMIDAMNATDLFVGASGTIKSEADGLPEKSPLLITVKEMKFTEYQPPYLEITAPE